MPEILLDILACIFTGYILWKFVQHTQGMKLDTDMIPENELQWTDQPVIGLSLTLLHKSLNDSYGIRIKDDHYYWVAKHLPTGAIVIIDVEYDHKHRKLNKNLHEQGRLN